MQFSIYQESRRGARKSNQDRVAYCYSRDALLMLVADGMGGHLHGETAAQIALQFITEAFRREARPGLSDPRSFLRQAITGAHGAIIQNADDAGLPEAPRTTCVACVVQDNTACWAHAGDSRLYHIRDGRILAQTKDHSLVQQLIDRGRMRAEAIAAHPQRNRIFNCLGSARPPRVDLSEPVRLDAGDSLILCSDGLWSPLSAKIISGAVLKSGIMQAVPELLDEAERRAGRECDNLSAIAVTWEEHAQAVRPDQAPARRTPLDSVTALPQESGAAESQKDYLSDDEIERAIGEIRSTIQRQSNDKT
ncbi:MAG: protein phosphatase 2C domain-containing protein [Betaproteobacteria bacterium]|nr:protein phosphatase 2C domain-containing protein [Betaproteobacteria bacterium]